mgnify:CR=1 FL=1
MTTSKCSEGHQEIEFEGEFSALCPLCAFKAEAEGDAISAQEEAKNAINEWETNAQVSEHERDEAVDKMEKALDDLEDKEKELKEAQAEYLTLINKAIADASAQENALNAKISELEAEIAKLKGGQ